jgi:hypothetical protein
LVYLKNIGAKTPSSACSGGRRCFGTFPENITFCCMYFSYSEYTHLLFVSSVCNISYVYGCQSDLPCFVMEGFLTLAFNSSLFVIFHIYVYQCPNALPCFCDGGVLTLALNSFLQYFMFMGVRVPSLSL